MSAVVAHLLLLSKHLLYGNCQQYKHTKMGTPLKSHSTSGTPAPRHIARSCSLSSLLLLFALNQCKV